MSTAVSFVDKTVLVTGASSGVGRAVAMSLGNAGARLVLVARASERLDATLEAVEGQKSIAIPCDLSSEEQVDSLFSTLKERSIRLDGVVHSAGTGYNLGIDMYCEEQAKALFDINFFSFCRIMRYCSKRRYLNNGSSVVAISSLAAVNGSKAQSIYAATKGALEAFSRIAAKELLHKGIRVNCVQPAQIDTALCRDVYAKSPESREKALRFQPLGIIDPDILAKFIVFLLSDDARYITGQTIPVDSGAMSLAWME